MTTTRFSTLLGLPAVVGAMMCSTPAASAQTVRAVMFYSPTCPHCEQVIRQDLPVFFGLYGGSPQAYSDESVPQNQRYVFLFSNGELEILLVNASLRPGGQLFEASFESHGRPSGVPRMIIQDDVLVGSIEIPNRLHDLIQAAQSRGGVDWPSIPGLNDAIAGIPQAAPFTVMAESDSVTPDSNTVVDAAREEPEEPATEPRVPRDTQQQRREAVTREQEPQRSIEGDTAHAATDSVVADTTGAAETISPSSDLLPPTQTTLESVATQRLSMLENFRRDPIGNGLSVLVLVGMIVSLLVLPRYARPSGQHGPVGIAVPVLSLVGIAVAAYLTYIEVGEVTAVCGPVGDCNTVNQSEYANLFGVIPVGALGLAGYVAVIVTWFAGRYASEPLANWSTVALFAGAAFGTLFSVYLTFLEPFVIGATCAWCLTSAVIITVLMWLSARPAAEAWAGLRGSGSGEPGTGESS